MLNSIFNETKKEKRNLRNECERLRELQLLRDQKTFFLHCLRYEVGVEVERNEERIWIMGIQIGYS